MGSRILTGSRKERASALYLWISLLLKVVQSLGFVEEVRGVVHDSQQFRQPPLPSPPPGWQLWACFLVSRHHTSRCLGSSTRQQQRKCSQQNLTEHLEHPVASFEGPLLLKSGSGSFMLINLFSLWPMLTPYYLNLTSFCFISLQLILYRGYVSWPHFYSAFLLCLVTFEWWIGSLRWSVCSSFSEEWKTNKHIPFMGCFFIKSD